MGYCGLTVTVAAVAYLDHIQDNRKWAVLKVKGVDVHTSSTANTYWSGLMVVSLV